MSCRELSMSPFRDRHDWIWVKAEKNWLTLVYVAVIVSVILTLAIVEMAR